jgi:predicted permease
MLRKKPAFTAVAVLSLALGIGANTAIFSALNAILLRSLPLDDPARLVLFDDHASEGTSIGDPSDEVWRLYSFPSYRHFADNVKAFEALAAFRSGETRLKLSGETHGDGAAQLATGQLVSGNYFEVLKANAALGRALRPSDDVENAAAAAVVSYGYWKRRLAADPSAVGRVVQLNGTAFTIVGVMPESFFGIRVRRPADFWLPLHFQPQIEQRESNLQARDIYWLNLVGRLAPGTDLPQAQAAVDVAFKNFLRQQAGPDAGEEWKRAIEHASIRLAPGERGISGYRTYYGEALGVLMFVTTFVLIIACANIANLSLSRATERAPEVSMRLALGASRWRLARQLLTESVLLSLIGGAAGLLLALWGVDALKKLVSASAPVDVGLSLPVLAFTAAVSIVAGVLFGLAPALRAGRSDLTTAMRSRVEGGSGRLRAGLGPALVVSQVALSLVLLVGSVLLIRSLRNLAQADVGFVRDGVLVVDIDTRIGGLGSAELSDYYRRLLERVQAIPGVRAATVASVSPMNGSSQNSDITIEGYTAPEQEDMEVNVLRIGPRYVETLGVPLLEGRQFEPRDGPSGPSVGLVNQAFVRSFFQGRSPLGKRFGIGGDTKDATIEIVGVLGDSKYQDAREAPVRSVFIPLLREQGQSGYSSDLEIRTSVDPSSLVTVVRQAITEVDARVPIAGVKTLAQQVAESMRREQLLARLVGAFGVLALVLACVGLYGLVSQAVARRTNEVGIRMALGASSRNILVMVLREAGTLVAAGIAIGIPAALLASRLLKSQLFGVGPTDPATLAGSCALLAAVAIAASYFPARRAAGLQPMTSLRAE